MSPDPADLRAGFTLVETLIGLILVGMVVLLGQQALETVLRAGRALDGDPGADTLAAAQVRDWLQAARPVPAGPAGERTVMFEGREQRVSFVTLLPERFGRAGPHLVSIGTTPGQDGLRMAWTIQRPDAAWPDPADGRTLLADLRGLRIAYFDPAARAWVDAWRERPDAPAAVSLSGRREDGPWSLTVRLRMVGNGT